MHSESNRTESSGSGDAAPDSRLRGATALVTGGGRGIGRHVALALAAAGTRVGVTARSVDELDETVASVRSAGGEAVAAPGDASSRDEVERVVSQVEDALGPVDVLVNAAGIWTVNPAPVWDSDPDEWWRVVEVNLRGPMLFVRQVVPGMVQRGWGCVVNVNSLAGADSRTARRGSSSYGVSKAGLYRLTSVLAHELADRDAGVKVFDLSPGLVRTRLTEASAFAGSPPDAWTDVDVVADTVVAMADGRLDAWSGCCIDARDDVDELVRRADGRPGDARTLTLRPYGDDDPLFSDGTLAL